MENLAATASVQQVIACGEGGAIVGDDQDLIDIWLCIS